MHYRPTKAFINLSALQHNLEIAKKMANQSKVLAVIKANGYGHGMTRVAKALCAADGFGVAGIEDALLLRKEGFLHPILLLEGVFSYDEIALAQYNRLDLVIHSQYQLDWLLEYPESCNFQLWLKIDTGMHRLGFEPAEVDSVIAQLEQSHHQCSLVSMSHFACADEKKPQAVIKTNAQQQIFEDTSHKTAPRSLANSAGLINYPHSHYDWVRPGIMLYGAGFGDNTSINLFAAMRFESKIQSLKWIKKDEWVGYGHHWQAAKDTLIAVVAVGYGDGYPRHAKNGTPVVIHNQRCPLVGRVSMDMIMVDVTQISDEVKIFDKVVLWGDELLSVDEVAQNSETIGYELLCGVTKRVPIIEEK